MTIEEAVKVLVDFAKRDLPIEGLWKDEEAKLDEAIDVATGWLEEDSR